MKIGEVCLLTNDVNRLADFYKAVLGIRNDTTDPVHQILIAEETQLTIYNDGTNKPGNNKNICLAFTVEDIDKEYEFLKSLGAEIIEKPARRPWGTINMSFLDPDGNTVYFRSFDKQKNEG